MTRTYRLTRSALASLWFCLSVATAQTSPSAIPPSVISPPGPESETTVAPASPATTNSAMSAETFYEIMLGEMNIRAGEPGTGFSLLLDAARKSNDAALYQRAVEVALQGRSGEAALQAARAWRQAQPKSRSANRALLQILLALNRLNDTLEPLKLELSMAEVAERPQVIAAIPRSYLQASDKKLATSVVEQAVMPYTTGSGGAVVSNSAGAAWLAMGRMRLSSDDLTGALDAAQRAQTLDAGAAGPALLALELMERKQVAAEPLVSKYLENMPEAEVRMAYARVLTDLHRYPEAIALLKRITQDKPDFADSWLLLGSLQLQERQAEAAESALKHFVEAATVTIKASGEQPDAQDAQELGQRRSRALAQAYLLLAQIAEERKDYAAAEAWIGRIENPEALVGAQTRRASLLARQGKLAEARLLIQALPEKDDEQARLKIMAEAQLLRDNKQFAAAYELVTNAVNKSPDDVDLLYEQAMLAEKLMHLDEMERLLRRTIQLKPSYHQAYNALGFSLADRNVRLPEAKQLIVKALEATPHDPFIQDSLAWVEFRMGNKTEALRILEGAYRARPDVEIAAHLGEVLWSLGHRSKAIVTWKEGQQLNRDNDTLMETLKRLRVQL